MNATRKKRKSLPRPTSPAPRRIFFPSPFSRDLYRARTRAYTHIHARTAKSAHLHSARSDKDGKWPAFACLFHFFNSVRSFFYPVPPPLPRWRFTRNHTHAGKIYGKTRCPPPPPLPPPGLNRVLRWQKPRDRILCAASAAAALGSSYLRRSFRPCTEVFIRGRVVRRSVPSAD